MTGLGTANFINGHVLDSESGAAIKSASVHLAQWPGNDVIDETSTDEGLFMLEDVACGYYIPQASKGGYMYLMPRNS